MTKEEIARRISHIRPTIRVELTTKEAEDLLLETQNCLARQAPFFDATLLFREQKLKLALGQIDE